MLLSDAVLDILAKNSTINAPKQALDFFENKEHKDGTSSQQVRGDCVFYTRTVTSTGAVRLVEHLASKCTVVQPPAPLSSDSPYYH